MVYTTLGGTSLIDKHKHEPIHKNTGVEYVIEKLTYKAL